MKRATLMTALFTGLLTFSMASQGFFSSGEGPYELTEGKTTPRLASGVDRYELELDDPSSVTIESGGWHPGGGQDGEITGVLLDESGNVIERAQSSIGNFVINQQLAAGDYVLEVSGAKHVGRLSHFNYHLEVRID